MIPLIVTLVAIVTPVLCCSPPSGGYVPPTPAEKVNFATNIIIGEVRANLSTDPLYGHMNYGTTYGVEVYVQCVYKGSQFPGFIKIGGAGFIPGMCTSKDLEIGKKYLIFLSGAKQAKDTNDTVYEQTQMADESVKVRDYLDVCGLEMDFPYSENGFMLKRRVCDDVKEGPCKTYNVERGKVETRQRGTQTGKIEIKQAGTDSSTPIMKMKKTVNPKEVVSVDLEQSQSTTQDPGNGREGLATSFGLLLTSFLLTIV